MTNYSRSVLKSNGLHCPKIRLKKFGFSSKSVPANIAKKLPPQRCSKLLLIAFSAFLTNGPCSLSRAKAGTHSALLKGIAHSGLHAETGGVSDGGAITTLGAFCTVWKPCAAGYQNGALCRFGGLVGGLPKNTESLRNSDALMRVAVPQASRPRWAAQPLLWSSWLSCFCLKPLLQTALRHGTMVSPNRNP